jgi:hypothetical protein
MPSLYVKVFDRDRNDPKARVLREFELVGQSMACAWRAAAEAASALANARDYVVER